MSSSHSGRQPYGHGPWRTIRTPPHRAMRPVGGAVGDHASCGRTPSLPTAPPAGGMTSSLPTVEALGSGGRSGGDTARGNEVPATKVNPSTTSAARKRSPSPEINAPTNATAPASAIVIGGSMPKNKEAATAAARMKTISTNARICSTSWRTEPIHHAKDPRRRTTAAMARAAAIACVLAGGPQFRCPRQRRNNTRMRCAPSSWASSAADLKFLSDVRRARHRNFKS